VICPFKPREPTIANPDKDSTQFGQMNKKKQNWAKIYFAEKFIRQMPVSATINRKQSRRNARLSQLWGHFLTMARPKGTDGSIKIIFK
jgi:hypothetical protein